MSFTANLIEVSAQENARLQRHSTRLDASARSSGRPPQPVIVHNISRHGALFEAHGAIATDELVQLDIPGLGTIPSRIAWANGTLFGCNFAQALDDGAIRNKIDSEKVVWGRFSSDRKPGLPVRRAPSETAPLPLAAPDLLRSRPAMPRSEDPRLPIGVRVAIIVGGATACWAIPGAILYWLIG